MRESLDSMLRYRWREKYWLDIFVISVVLLGIVSFIWLPACGRNQQLELDDPAYELYMINSDGSNPTRLEVKGGTQPAWSPDGSSIAFWKFPYEIGVVNEDRVSLHSLHRLSMDNRTIYIPWPLGGPAWSRDGKRIAIAFQSPRGGKLVFAEVNTDGSEPREVDKLIEPYLGLGFSPDGKKQIVLDNLGRDYYDYYAYYDIYVSQVDGSGQTFIGRWNNGKGWFGGSWFPDSKRIAFGHLDFIGGWWPRPEIYIVNAEGSLLKKLKGGGVPVVSPDGTKIAYGEEDILVMNSDGSKRIRVTNSPTTEWLPTWSSDSNKIVFVVSPRRPVGWLYIPPIEQTATFVRLR